MTKVLSPTELAPGLRYIGHPGVLLYLVEGTQSCLIDSGMTAMGPLIRRDLDMYLGDLKNLDLHLLTHSHYDHVGSSTFLAEQCPALTIAAHANLADVIQRPNAISLIRKLNETIMGGPPPADQPDMVAFGGFDVNRKLDGGERFDFGDFEIQVLYTPGHTRDSVSYYLPTQKAVILGEAAGVPDMSDSIMPEFLQSYTDYMNSLDKLAALDLEFICLPHNYVLAGEPAKSYMQRSIQKSISFKDRLLAQLNDSNGDIQHAFETLFEKMYRPGGQPKDAFSINLQAMVKTIAREFA